ncbi:MAG TPA: hypothetical protein PKC93_10165 [Candidatus Obscuribacter sp.]|nr:hypothetical protein [Candidatus Obscuribacter sp.]HMX46303.1 hypothetical protein [Candidatus Obscuribacter sp.]
MVSTQRRRVNDEPVSLSYDTRSSAARVARVSLVTETRRESAPVAPVAFDYSEPRSDSARVVKNSSVQAVAPGRQQQQEARPYLVPLESPKKGRRVPVLVRINRTLQAGLIALCGLAIFAYGMNVNDSHNVGKLQEQVRRLSEQNSELSNRVLKEVSYQGISENVSKHKGLVVPEVVKICKEVPAPKLSMVKAAKHHLPLMSGY